MLNINGPPDHLWPDHLCGDRIIIGTYYDMSRYVLSS